MKRLTASILSLTLCVTGVFARQKDSLDVTSKTVILQDPAVEAAYGAVGEMAPAMRMLAPVPGSSSAGAGMVYRDGGRALVPEEGKGVILGRFDAQSFLRRGSDTALRGKVSYRRGKKTDVSENLTTNYLLLRPYVLRDTLCGDLQHESYCFSGGWSHRTGKLIFDIGGEYEATHEYRTVDPRPRDISSDFKVDGSIGLDAGAADILLGVGYRRYSQGQNVVFMKESGANTALFHATGLGNDYVRFRSTGVFAATRYAGGGVRSSLTLLGAQKKLATGVSYEYMALTRYLSNQNDAPLTRLHINTLNANLSYRFNSTTTLLAEASYEHKEGEENVIDCAASGIYNKLLSLGMYSSDRVLARVSAVTGFRGWAFTPRLTFYHGRESYLYPAASQKYSLLYGDVSVSYRGVSGKWFYKTELDAGYGKGYALGSLGAYAQREINSSMAVFAKFGTGVLAMEGGQFRYGCGLNIGISF